jgi:hypothetical protein
MAGKLKLISVLMAGAILLFALLAIGGAVLVFVMAANRQLPNGYKVFSASSSECYITNADGQQVVRPHVIEWTTQPNGLVTGQLSSGETFTLDTNTGSVNYSGSSADNAEKPAKLE